MQKRLIKYLEENFNPEILYNADIEVFFESDLHVSDLPTVVKAFEGELHIDFGGNGLVDDDNRLCLFILFDNPYFSYNKTRRSTVTIYNLFSKELYEKESN